MSDELNWVTVDETVTLNKHVVAFSREPHQLVHPNNLDAALNRPIQLFHYGDLENRDDLVLLGAQLCVGISESQAFFQGNKRTGFAGMALFFANNGYQIAGTTPGDVADMILATAHPDRALRMSEEEFAEQLDPFIVEVDEFSITVGGITMGQIVALGGKPASLSVGPVTWGGGVATDILGGLKPDE